MAEETEGGGQRITVNRVRVRPPGETYFAGPPGFDPNNFEVLTPPQGGGGPTPDAAVAPAAPPQSAAPAFDQNSFQVAPPSGQPQGAPGAELPGFDPNNFKLVTPPGGTSTVPDMVWGQEGYQRAGPPEDEIGPAFGVPPSGTKGPAEKARTMRELREMEEPKEKRNLGPYGFTEIYPQLRQEAQDQMAKGREQLFGTDEAADAFKGMFNMGVGALSFINSPIQAAYRVVAGNPVEHFTGVPREYTETIGQLLTPGIGLTAIPGTSKLAPAIEHAGKTFAPDKVSPAAQEAAGIIRQRHGLGARDTISTMARLEPYLPTFNKLSPMQQWMFVHDFEKGIAHRPPITQAEKVQLTQQLQSTRQAIAHIQNAMHARNAHLGAAYQQHFAQQLPAAEAQAARLEAELARGTNRYSSPALRAMADEMRHGLDMRKTKIENTPSLSQVQFIEEYFPHMWQDQNAAQQFVNNWYGVGKEGSGGALKKRSIPTIMDGMAAGLKPAGNPMELYGRYMSNMDRYIATEEILQIGKNNGTVVMRTPGQRPNDPDLVPLDGRFGDRAKPMQAWAPADWARIYNNFVGKGYFGSETAKPWYETALKTSNAVTQAELAFSGFHALTMSQEAVVNGVARSIMQGARGDVKASARSLVRAPGKFVTDTIRGAKGENIYLGKSPGTAADKELVDILTEAGARMSGAAHAADYSYTAMGSYWTAWRRGALSHQMYEASKRVANNPSATLPGEIASIMGRTMETVAQPIFQAYIPKLKNGAAMDNLADWLKANPNATRADKVKAARDIWDSVDNRFGEMVHDNVFWNNTLKQSAMFGMRSYSWTYGFLREAGGGFYDVSRLARGEGLSQRTAYIMALPIVYGTVNGAYHYLRTGERPTFDDMSRGGMTGGTQPGAGGREVPERAQAPGFWGKDMLGWFRHPVVEARNKMSTLPRTVAEVLFNADWKDDVIANPNEPQTEQMAEYFKHVMKSMIPFSAKQLYEGRPTGSNMSKVEDVLGVKQAPTWQSDPEGYKKQQWNLYNAKSRRRDMNERRRQQRYEGADE